MLAYMIDNLTKAWKATEIELYMHASASKFASAYNLLSVYVYVIV